LTEFQKNMDISNFTKIRPVGAELLHADRSRDRNNKAKSCFSQLYESD